MPIPSYHLLHRPRLFLGIVAIALPVDGRRRSAGLPYNRLYRLWRRARPWRGRLGEERTARVDTGFGVGLALGAVAWARSGRLALTREVG
jgi:hypothetical protein